MSTGTSGLSTGISSLSTGLSTTTSRLNNTGTGVAAGLGGGSTYDPATGTVTAPAYTVYNANGTTGTAGSVGAVVDSINSQGIKYFHINSSLPDAVASGANAVAMGPQALASGTNSIAVGLGAQATGTNAIAIGAGALATGSVALGVGSRAGGGGTALGDLADAGGTPLSAAPAIGKGTAVGFGALVQTSGGVALGSGSVASTGAGVAGYVPGTATAAQAAAIQATTSTQAAVSVGDAANGQFRQINGVAAGTADSDATNVAQLRATANAVQSSSVQYGTNADGSTNYGQVSLGNGQAPNGVRVSNVAPGILPSDAVNVAQLRSVQAQVGDVARIAYSGTAMAIALSGNYMMQPRAGKTVVGVGVGSYSGYAAAGVSFRTLAPNGRVMWGAGISGTGKQWSIGAGMSMELD